MSEVILEAKNIFLSFAGVSALSGGYAGISLYQWGDGGLGPKFKKFYGGIEVALC